MGNFTRRGSFIGAAVLAGALALGTAASADVVDGEPIDVDGPVDIENPDGPEIYRFAGPNRVLTALEAAERTDGWGDTVIIATSDDFADALSATTLADVLDAPVLLNHSGDEVDEEVAEYIEANFSNVILVGGTGVFTNEFADEVSDLGLDVSRYDGANRYETALALAAATVEEAGWTGEGAEDFNIFLASGMDYPDALAAGAAASEDQGIVLLTNGYDGLGASTYDVVSGASLLAPGTEFTGSIVAVGGPAAAAAEEGEIGGDNSAIEVDVEVVGDNRYETSVMLAEEIFEDGATNFVIASGLDFPDAVVGGAYAANVDGALLLTRNDELHPATADYLAGDRREEVENVFVFGGTGSVSRQVSEDLRDLAWDF